MGETIESFVAKLQAEGVQAGREKADKLAAEAQGRAEEIVRQAEERAKKTVADAQSKAKELLAKSSEELELASRDAVLKLRDALGQALQAIVTAPVREHLSKPEFLKGVIHDLVVQYAAADQKGAGAVVLNLTGEMKDQLGDWALQELRRAASGSSGAPIDLRATLKQAGFEYRASGGTVEVTVDSVVETLRELVGASLRDKLDKALKGREG